jgi:arabinan endo-1,5-alpha-L-arabinosidase
VFKLGGTWYCYYAVSFLGSHISQIGVATSPMLRPYAWVDHGSIGLPQNTAWNLIDPYLFQESDDSPLYFTFGSHWQGIYQFEINPVSEFNMRAWTGHESDIKNVIRNTTADAAVVEGAITYKHDDYYYMFFSVGQCCRPEHELANPGDEYRVAVCRAEDVTGPYVDAQGKSCADQSGGTTILASHGDVYAPGGQGVMWDEKSEKEVMYYHYSK